MWVKHREKKSRNNDSTYKQENKRRPSNALKTKQWKAWTFGKEIKTSNLTQNQATELKKKKVAGWCDRSAKKKQITGTW